MKEILWMWPGGGCPRHCETPHTAWRYWQRKKLARVMLRSAEASRYVPARDASPSLSMTLAMKFLSRLGEAIPRIVKARGSGSRRRERSAKIAKGRRPCRARSLRDLRASRLPSPSCLRGPDPFVVHPPRTTTPNRSRCWRSRRDTRGRCPWAGAVAWRSPPRRCRSAVGSRMTTRSCP